MYDIIIIGAGCAGLTAAVYAARAGKSVLVLEAENIGGQISYSPKVENFPSIRQISGSEFADNLFEQASALGVQLELERVTHIENGGTKKVHTEDSVHECRCVIIATGVKHRHLGVDREEDFPGKGLSSCPICDGAFYKGKKVAVPGGGNSALQSAAMLAGTCEKVYLIHRRDTFRGEQAKADELKKLENVEFVLNSIITDLAGDDVLTGVTVCSSQQGECRNIALDGLSVSVGHMPENSVFEGLVQLDESGYIIAGEDCKTTAEGIFAAGDCRTKQVRQLTTAAADGSVAALAAVDFIG
ncbi:MAG: FAD-dependent oxidoreductase [Clostridiales bacterium]|nr:FAD-dependent oxidoreductase [Clostridiales bacterium]